MGAVQKDMYHYKTFGLELLHFIIDIDGYGLLDWTWFSNHEIYHPVIVWIHKGVVC